jgi:hypothetical protein
MNIQSKTVPTGLESRVKVSIGADDGEAMLVRGLSGFAKDQAAEGESQDK